jgi:hypothetical protein
VIDGVPRITLGFECVQPEGPVTASTTQKMAFVSCQYTFFSQFWKDNPYITQHSHSKKMTKAHNNFETTHKGSNQYGKNIEPIVDAFRRGDDDLQEEAQLTKPSSDAPTRYTAPSKHSVPKPYRFVPLKMGGDSGRTHVVSNDSRRLIQEEVTLADLEKMTSLFYEKAFLDPTLDQFIRNHGDPHGARFAKWIHQKLSGSDVWDQDRRTRNLSPVTLAEGFRHVVHDRSSAHAAAWYSPKRPSEDVGRHFQLDECRVWMRLHFWALRESGIMEKSSSFADYYVRFIGHFVRVYESTAPQFARDSLRWSADPKNIEGYIQNGRRMDDILNRSLQVAKLQIPYNEANDFVWPYNKVDPQLQ